MRMQATKHDAVRCVTPRSVVLALVLAILLHQALMTAPLHANMTLSPSAIVETNTLMPYQDACPPALARICASVEQVLPPLFALPLVLLTLLGIMAVAFTYAGVPIYLDDWLWPPDRRRALLQVFRV